ncbi:Vacuolar protein sorting-associated VPS28 [Penicillium expansum]|nr:Vacuolar protein sorting-associated VPS28 [Penicillium expansum]
MIGLLALTSIPTVTGVALASSEQRKANQRKEEARRMVKFNIVAECDGDTDDDRELNGMAVVVRDEKVYLADPDPSKRSPPAFTALAFYIEYPEPEELKYLKRERGLGLPTYVQDNPPLLNWIYADTETHELRYGNRSQSVEQLVEPWDWCKNEKFISLEGNQNSFIAVEEEEGEWALHYDRDGDELAGVLEEQGLLDCAFVPVKLVRKVVEERPPPPPAAQAAAPQSQGNGQSQK